MFLSAEQVKAFTGCCTPAAQIVWLRANHIDHLVNHLRQPVVAAAVLEVERPSNWKVNPFPSKTAMLQGGYIIDARQCGVYFLMRVFRKNRKEIIYIGKTANLLSRIADHMLDKQFDELLFLPTDAAMLDIAEQEYIRRYLPPLNIKHIPAGTALNRSGIGPLSEVEISQFDDSIAEQNQGLSC